MNVSSLSLSSLPSSLPPTLPSSEPTLNPEITCSHERFWIFSQVSQWGSHWRYSQSDRLNQVRSMMVIIRTTGISQNLPPRVVHIAQILVWRFYMKKDPAEYPFKDIMPYAFECAALILPEDKSIKEKVAQSIRRDNRSMDKNSEFKKLFETISILDFSLEIHHPSEYLRSFFTTQATPRQIELASCIISDSFMCPCCLVHKPEVIAEGAAIMAAGMTDSPGSVLPKTQEALSFVEDMQYFYTQNLSAYSK